MQLSYDDAARFFKLMPALQTFANQRLKVIKDMDGVEQYQKISNEKRVKLRNAFYKKPELIDEFVRENPFSFSSDELSIIAGWKNFICGDFFIKRVTRKYAAAKQQGKIIESLDPDWVPSRPKAHVEKDWKPILDELFEKSSKLRGSGNSPAIYGPAFSLVKASLEFARTAVEFPEDLDKLDKALDKVMRASNKAEKTMYFMDFQF